MVGAAATSTPPVTLPRGLEVPVQSPVGFQTGAEEFDVGTPEITIENQDKKVKELEKKVMQLEAMIKEFLKGEDPWQRKVGGDEAVAPSDAVAPSKELGKMENKEDELKPMHPKDSKPPPEFSGARKDFMVWHENFTSMLRLRSAKWGKVIEWLRSRREKRLADGQAKADYVA